MAEIKSFPFKKENFDQIRSYKFGKNWPVVYIIENNNEAYVGQSINAYYRSLQHFESPDFSQELLWNVIGEE